MAIYSLEEIYAQWKASKLQIRPFQERYYPNEPFNAFRCKMKRVQAKLLSVANDGNKYDMPLIEQAIRNVKDRWFKIAVLSDIHFGDHDGQALELAYRAIEAFQPHLVTFGGDELNFDKFSRHPIDPRHDDEGEPDSLHYVRPFHQMHVSAVESAVPGSIKVFRLGNHENWYYRQTMEFLPGAIGVMNDAFIDMVRCHGQVFYPGETDRIKVHGVNLQHLSKGGVNPAKSNMSDYDFQESVVAEHIHKFNLYTIHGRERQLVSVTNRCLCNLTPYYAGYVKKPTKWEHGITLLEIDTRNLDEMPIVHPLLFSKNKSKLSTRFWGKEISV